ncbi:MAG TPA: sulfocyanin-like copper-binding protein [Hypericibacter adhaerens]|uniref:sulfocyanin-like copper-binding protein n=1 Tax=Hypericibacter adhaerens TaxID=2602016 RepID=UPI002B518BF4|nr:sulfocyanin-like copper-binding protein [Hypericibacter adhaerens]HWA45233.1 sulfocyanin-like copper-binding protein [Hypericibacter adhaerens]
MKSKIRSCLAALALVCTSAIAAGAAAPSSTVRVALLDMTAVAGGGAGVGMMGYGPGMMGPWGAGPGAGGMMGYGPGMMGAWGNGPSGGMMGGGMMGGGMMGHGMMTVRADQDSVPAGTVTLDITNWSRSVVHEVLVVAVDSPTAPLPYDYNSWRVVEDQIKVAGDSGELSPNVSKTLELNLSPGTYLLICNVAGHYAAGMALPLTVTP